MDRRKFLKTGLAATGSLLVGCSATKIKNIFGDRPKVVVVGAGLSGLTVAWELRKKNFDVIVLEANDRVGGRVLTERNGFLDGQYTEQGATIIPDIHELTLAYANEFKLGLTAFPAHDPSIVFYFKQKRYVDNYRTRAYYPEEWELTEEEERNGLEWIQTGYFKKGFGELGDPSDPKWKTQEPATTLDKIPYTEFLRRHGASETAIAMELAVEGSGGSRNSAANWIVQAYLDRNLKKFLHITGGNDLLPRAFADRLREKIVLGAKVQEIAGNTVRFRKGGTFSEIAADAVVFTVSPAVLRKMKFTSPLSAAKESAIRSVDMAPVTKVSAAMKERYWKQIPVDSLFAAYSDTFVERIWDISVTQPGQAGLLIGYAQEEHAVALSKYPREEQMQRTLAMMEKILPGAKKNFAGGSSYSWHEQDWVGGGWVSYVTNQLPLMDELGRTEGNYFFAGDHTSLRNAWMQGAFESANRVVSEIVARFSA